VADDQEVVRDAGALPYAPRAILDADTLESLCEANIQFLDLVAEHGDSGQAEAYGFPREYVERLQQIGPEGRREIADCPYTLFNMRFEDAPFWRAVQRRAPGPTAASPNADIATARSGAYLAWYLSRSDDRTASLVLGMTLEAQRVWRGIALSRIDAAATAALPDLRARWVRQPSFWPTLLDSVGPANRKRAEAVRLLGLQLIAAESRWPRLDVVNSR
jgi:uncharacterized protein with LGFP repeats